MSVVSNLSTESVWWWKKMNYNSSFYSFHSTELKINFYSKVLFLLIDQTLTFTFTFIDLNTIIFLLIFDILFSLYIWYDLDKYNKCR